MSPCPAPKVDWSDGNRPRLVVPDEHAEVRLRALPDVLSEMTGGLCEQGVDRGERCADGEIRTLRLPVLDGPCLSGTSPSTWGSRRIQGSSDLLRPAPSRAICDHAVTTRPRPGPRSFRPFLPGLVRKLDDARECVRYLDEMTETDQRQELDPWLLVEEVQEQDPERALSAIGALRGWLEEMEEDAVVRARAEGYPWGRIASCLGRSKQGVWEKHRDPGESLADGSGEVAR